MDKGKSRVNAGSAEGCGIDGDSSESTERARERGIKFGTGNLEPKLGFAGLRSRLSLDYRKMAALNPFPVPVPSSFSLEKQAIVGRFRAISRKGD